MAPASPDLLAHWSRWYPDAPPVGFLLAMAYPDRRFRIHTYPDARRWPRSADDYRELLALHNPLAADVLGPSPHALILLDECERWQTGETARLIGISAAEMPILGPRPDYLCDPDHDDSQFEVPMCLYGREISWQSGSFDQFIRAVADDAAMGLVFALATGHVYAPYDGGADLFFPTSEARDAMREMYSHAAI
jgi:hypothetical protein